MATGIKHQRHIGAVVPKDTSIDHRYQRPIVESMVRKMAANWDPDKAGVITVSKRGNGEVVVLDGQQRREARLRIDSGKTPLDAILYTGLTVKEEAARFLGLNDNARLNQYDLYRAKVAAGDSIALGAQAMIDDLGLAVRPGGGPTNVSAAGLLLRLYASNPTELRASLQTLREAWPKDRGALQGWLFKGLVEIFRSSDGNLDRKRLTKVLAQETPTSILRMLPGTSSAPAQTHVVPVLRDLYNKRLAGDRKI